MPVFLRRVYRDEPDLQRLPCILTVHNGGFQGVFPQSVLRDIALPDDLWSPDFMEWYGRLNYLKGGLTFADMVTTVSPTHAFELLTDVGGFGLQHTFRKLGDRLVGIRNGIDVEKWNPVTDKQIPAHFSAQDLSGKVRCKAVLQEAWGLPRRADIPLFGMSARLVAQKGLDQIVASQSLRLLDAQFIFLGAGEAQFEQALRELSARYPARIGLNTAFTDALEHQLVAATGGSVRRGLPPRAGDAGDSRTHSRRAAAQTRATQARSHHLRQRRPRERRRRPSLEQRWTSFSHCTDIFRMSCITAAGHTAACG